MISEPDGKSAKKITKDEILFYVNGSFVAGVQHKLPTYIFTHICTFIRMFE